MARKKFLRHKWRKYSKLGRGRKKKQKYRKPTGRHNKMRKKMKGNPRKVSIGYKKARKQEITERIVNIKDLEKAKKDAKIILGRVGKKNKIEIVKKAEELGIRFENLNINKFLRDTEKEKEKSEEKKKDKKTGDKKK